MVCSEQTKREYIAKRLSLNQGDKIEEALKYSQYLYDNENHRKATIEGKANTLIAATGIATAFMIGFLGLLSHATDISKIMLASMFLVYIGVVYYLLRCVYYAVDTVHVRKYSYAIPDPEDIYNLKGKDIYEVKNERAVDYLFSYFRNRDLNNSKATSLNQAQEGLKRAIILLAILPILFCINVYAVNKGSVSNVGQVSAVSSNKVNK